MVERSIDTEIRFLVALNYQFGKDYCLTEEERKALRILSRARSYLELRRSWGEEILDWELENAGLSTKEFDPELEGFQSECGICGYSDHTTEAHAEVLDRERNPYGMR